MPAKNLVELCTLDLSKAVATKEDIHRYLKQRGRFSMLDGILHEDIDGKFAVGFKEIRSDDWWASDHIPGRPLFPGALMIETAAQLASYDFQKNRSEVGDDRFLGFGGLEKTRFRGAVIPDCRMIFVASLKRIRTTMFVYATQGFVADELVFETEVLGVVV